jgi:isopenicillin N synthase-like dioxygenase
MIPRIDLQALIADDSRANSDLLAGITDFGFLIVYNSPLSGGDVTRVTEMYRQFFHLSDNEKSRVSMVKTGSNRGWGASGSEQVDPNATPITKRCLTAAMYRRRRILLLGILFMRPTSGLFFLMGLNG